MAPYHPQTNSQIESTENDPTTDLFNPDFCSHIQFMKHSFDVTYNHTAPKCALTSVDLISE